MVNAGFLTPFGQPRMFHVFTFLRSTHLVPKAACVLRMNCLNAGTTISLAIPRNQCPRSAPSIKVDVAACTEVDFPLVCVQPLASQSMYAIRHQARVKRDRELHNGGLALEISLRQEKKKNKENVKSPKSKSSLPLKSSFGPLPTPPPRQSHIIPLATGLGIPILLIILTHVQGMMGSCCLFFRPGAVVEHTWRTCHQCKGDCKGVSGYEEIGRLELWLWNGG